MSSTNSLLSESRREVTTQPSNKDDMSDKDNDKDDKNNGSRYRHSADDYQCNICLDIAKEAVVSLCGHMFCWPCLLQWLEIRPDNQTCPVCKSGISKDSVVPIYGRNSDHKDPRERHPPRPAGQRSEPSRSPFSMEGSGFQMSFGIGGFPIGLLSTTFNFGSNPSRGNTTSANQNNSNGEDPLLSRVFVCLAIVIIFWVLFG